MIIFGIPWVAARWAFLLLTLTSLGTLQAEITFSFTQRVNTVMTPTPDTEVLAGDVIEGHYTFDPFTPGVPYVGSSTNILKVYTGAVKSWEVTFVRLGITVTGQGGDIYIGNDTAFVDSDNYTVVLLPGDAPVVRFPSGRSIGNINVQMVDIDRNGDSVYVPADMLTNTNLPLVPPRFELVDPANLSGFGRFKDSTDQFQTSLLNLALVPRPAGRATLRGLDILPGKTANRARGISADGAVVVGDSQGVDGPEACRWTEEDGVEGLGDLPGGPLDSSASAVSGNGKIIVGYGETETGVEAFRWTKESGMVGLGHLPTDERTFYSVALGISADGSVVTGDSIGTNLQEAFRWTAEGGMVPLGNLVGRWGSSYGMAVSFDGEVIVGGSSSLISTLEVEPFRWTTASGMIGLGVLPGEQQLAQAQGVSYDGMVVAGASGLTHAFRWTPVEGMKDLGDLYGGRDYSGALAVSGDGNVIVGFGYSVRGKDAFKWTSNKGMESITDLLMADGVDLTGWSLDEATAVSADGQVIAGNGWHNGVEQAWVATIPIENTPEPTPTPTPTPTPPPNSRAGIKPPKVHLAGGTLRTTHSGFAILSGKVLPGQRVTELEIRGGGQVYKRLIDGTRTWYEVVHLHPGRNVFRIRAKNTSGPRSKPVRVTVIMSAG